MISKDSDSGGTAIKKIIISAQTIGFIILFSAQALGFDSAMKAPWENNCSSEIPEESYLVSSLNLAIGLYQTHSSGILTRPCPSSPSCSRYMLEAVNRFGFPLGVMLGLERLLHENGEIAHGSLIKTRVGFRIYDPLDSNIFWWSD